MFIVERYPQLLPTSHRTQLYQLLRELHSINYFSVSFPDKPQVAEAIKTAVLNRLEQPRLSQRYRNALQYKLEVIETEKIAAIKQDRVQNEVEHSRALLSTLESTLCSEGSSPWLFGFDGPTALDAHVVVFINRLRDVGRAKLISSTMAKYADLAMETSGWRKLMDGERAI
ncbi:hypothetical protein OIDMADRAFT_21372 [Oidiodendron maius Zn]|uniref:GST C-terminal domain-containing protein n=1 Tax=Oidiodendron maius (strain Zn) TaxID=913774 RepID=A0A0C3GTX4_OIDMZ|nr:hypothetical protein OIDMADRAFT_21372 [Oidiodendron maius Zn]